MAGNEEDEWQIEPIPDLWNNAQRDRLILKNIPFEFSNDGLRSLCSLYGNVVHLKQPNGAQYAFAQFEKPEQAHYMLCRFREDHPILNIIVEYAREREHFPANNANNEEYAFLDKPRMISEDIPLQNVLEMDKRQIQGPFADPVEFILDPVVQGKDYRNMLLLLADPTKEFLWNSNIEANIPFETNNNKKIIHGRAILKSSSVESSGKPVDLEKKSFSFNSELLPILKCANCPQAADKMCKECNEPQCSLECHAAKHKHSSETDQNLASPKISMSRIEAEPIKNAVKITYVINHCTLFVRPVDNQQEIAFARLICDTVKCAKDAATYKCLPSIGSLVLAKFDYYQRALVLKHIDTSKVAVVFIDFGNVEIRDFCQLKVMPDELKKHKRFATKIRLNKIDNDLMNEKALKFLYGIMATDTELSIKIDSSNLVPMADLKTSDKWVNQMINSLNSEDIKVPNIKDMSYRVFFGKQFVDQFAQDINIDQMTGKEMIILDNSSTAIGLLTLIDADHLQKFLQNDRRIQNICNHLFKEETFYTPKNDECCAVKHKGQWYRAHCMEVCFDGFVTMKFIDHGNMQLIEVNNIRPIPDALLFECLCIEANCFSDHGDMTPELMEQLKAKYPEKSRQKIKRMEFRTECYNLGEEALSLFIWF